MEIDFSNEKFNYEVNENFKVWLLFWKLSKTNQKVTRGVYFYNAGRLLYKRNKNTDSRKQEIVKNGSKNVTQNFKFQNRFCASTAGGL